MLSVRSMLWDHGKNVDEFLSVFFYLGYGPYGNTMHKRARLTASAVAATLLAYRWHAASTINSFLSLDAARGMAQATPLYM